MHSSLSAKVILHQTIISHWDPFNMFQGEMQHPRARMYQRHPDKLCKASGITQV